MQAYFTRKLGIQGAKIDEPGPFITQKVKLRESESDPIFATPTLNWSHDSARSKPLVHPVTFSDPLSETDQQTEIEQPRNTTKRPRIGSCSIVDIQPPPKFGLLSSYLNVQDPFGLSSVREAQDCILEQSKALRGSEIELETDVESATNPAGSTISQAVDSRPMKPRLLLSDNDSICGPTRFQESPRKSILRPSGRASSKEYFSTAEAFNLPRGHPVIALTELQGRLGWGGVLLDKKQYLSEGG